MRIPQLIAAVALATSISLTAATPVPSDFTYQGVLKVDGQPVQTDADFIIRLYDGATLVTSISRNLVPINDGQFKLDLDFDPAFFDGTDYDLEFLVRSPAGIGSYQALGARQPLTTTPYAFHANTADTLITPATIDADTPSPAVVINQAFEASNDVVALRATRGTVDTPSAVSSTIGRVAEFESADTPIAVLGLADGFSIVGLLDGNSYPFGIAVVGEIRSSGYSTQAAIQARNIPAGTNALLAVENYAGLFGGDVLISGDITKSFTPGSEDRAVPIAYGYINTNGTIASGTPNFSATWNASALRYEIEIDNESYFFSNYVTVVSTINANASIRTSSASGRLLVFIERTDTQADIQAGFQFITYKPNGAAAINGQRRAPLIPLANPITDDQLNPNPIIPQPRTPNQSDRPTVSLTEQN
ncbi:MAG: hypothetical protein R3B67_12400 [Phycisphaerales bacterium]